MNMKKIVLFVGLTMLSTQAFAVPLLFQVDNLTAEQTRRLKQIQPKGSKEVANVLYEAQINAILTPDQQAQLKALLSAQSEGMPASSGWYKNPNRDGKN